MNTQYLENPVLLLNSSGPIAANGRNARAKFRTDEAAKKIRSETRDGQFGVFELGQNVVCGAGSKSPSYRNKRKNITDCIPDEQKGVVVQRPKKSRRKGDLSGLVDPVEDISRLLDYATFHIRLLAAMNVSFSRSRLKHILLCRQWACICIGIERAGKSSVLESALRCVAARVDRLNGLETDDMVWYGRALAEVHEALENPAHHRLGDLSVSIQLLAMYEMLESVVTSGWDLHIGGVRALSNPEIAVVAANDQTQNLTISMTVPMVAEALIKGDEKLFETGNWRRFLLANHNNCSSPQQSQSVWATCMLDLPMLISDTKMLCSSFDSVKSLRNSLLNRALLLKSRIRSVLLDHDQRPVESNDKSVETYDKVGLCLAGLIALDRTIAFIEDADSIAQEIAEKKTADFCERFLQLDLGANGAYAAFDLMRAFSLSSFQEHAGYIIALPGRNRS